MRGLVSVHKLRMRWGNIPSLTRVSSLDEPPVLGFVFLQKLLEFASFTQEHLRRADTFELPIS